VSRAPSEPTDPYRLYALETIFPDSRIHLSGGVCTIGINGSNTALMGKDGVFPIYFGGASSRDWTMEVRFFNFKNAGQTGKYYEFSIGNGMDAPSVTAWVDGTWFDGTYEGRTYHNALILEAAIENELTGQSWEASEVVIEGLDPSTTTVALGIEVRNNGYQFVARYNINSGSWQHGGNRG